jgi:hypothetical protein
LRDEERLCAVEYLLMFAPCVKAGHCHPDIDPIRSDRDTPVRQPCRSPILLFGIAVQSFNFKMAADDLLHGFCNLPLVWTVARQDVKLRYARSVIGPLWITITMALYVVALGFVFGGLFGASIRDVVPWIALGMIAWNLLANILTEASVVLVQNRGLLLQAKLSVSLCKRRSNNPSLKRPDLPAAPE